MNPTIEALVRAKNAGYDELPDAVRSSYTEQQWLWLSDREKATLTQRETEPEN